MKKLFVSFLITFFAATTFAATAVIDFSGKTPDGTTCSLDKVLVENLTQGWSETTYNVSISYEIVNNDQAVEHVEADKDLIVKNSLDGNVNVQFNMSRPGQVSVFVYDIAGRSVCQSNTMQESGVHSLNLELGTPQMYYLYITTPANTYSCPILNTSTGNGTQIQYIVDINMAQKVPARYIESHTCNVGDAMQYTGHTTIGGRQYTNVQKATIKEGRTSIEFTFEVETADYYIKHPWGTGADADWAWEPMEKNESNYTYTGLWGGIGANINTDPTDAGAQWFSIGSISGAAGLTIGDEVTFVYNPSAGTLSISGGGTNPQQTGYYIKHPWGDGADASWSWQPMTKSGDKYTYSGLWGGVGANINVVADDGGAQWYPEYSISGSDILYIGEMATFTFVPSNGNVGTLSVSGASATIPNTPTNLKATATSSCIQLTWNAVSGATGYNIYMANSASGTYSKIDNATSNSYTDCYVSASYTYYYKVSAYNNAGESSLSSYVSAKISSGGGTTQLAAPTGVTATAATSKITVSWNSVSGANKYNVYRSTSSAGTYTQIASEYGTSHIDMNVTSGSTYYYKVAAVSSDGTVGKQSSAVSATISGGGGTTTLAAPTNVTAAYMQGVHQVQVTWSEVALCDSYEIYRSTSASSNGTKIGTATNSDGGAYVDKLSSSIDQTWYYYRVKAKSSYLNKTSDYSEQASVYIDKNPVAPCPASNLKITGTSSLSISWSVQTQSGCGTPTQKLIQFYDYSSSASDKWVDEKVTSNSYTLTSAKLNQYTNGGSTLVGCVTFYNASGKSCLHFEYNTSTKKVTIISTNCY